MDKYRPNADNKTEFEAICIKTVSVFSVETASTFYIETVSVL
jgi:hypothetical protein